MRHDGYEDRQDYSEVLSLATASEAGRIGIRIPRLATCCEVTGIPGPRYQVQPG